MASRQASIRDAARRHMILSRGRLEEGVHGFYMSAIYCQNIDKIPSRECIDFSVDLLMLTSVVHACARM